MKNGVFWDVTPKCLFLQEPHCVTSQKTAFYSSFIVACLNVAADAYQRTLVTEPSFRNGCCTRYGFVFRCRCLAAGIYMTIF
jgi:hypothetical protein